MILDNLSAHKSQVVRDFPATHPNAHLHITPTYSSGLNQVEIWFSKVERDAIARGIFASVKDLARKLRRYIDSYLANAEPIQWKCSDPTRRIRSDVVSATCRQQLSDCHRHALRQWFPSPEAGQPCWPTPSAILLRNATPSVFHQRDVGRVLRSSCNTRGRRIASTRGREPQPGRCPPLWPGDLRNDGGGVPAAGANGSKT